MRKRIRIIQPAKRVRHFAQVEARARRVVATGTAKRARPNRSIVARDLENQLALALDQLTEARRVHERFRHNIEESQSRLRMDILQREPRPPFFHYDPRLPERDMLRGRMLRLDAEARRHEVQSRQDLQRLEDRVAELLQRHQMFSAGAQETGRWAYGPKRSIGDRGASRSRPGEHHRFRSTRRTACLRRIRARSRTAAPAGFPESSS